MSQDFIAHLRDLAADFGALDARRMFGGFGVYRDGVMLGLIFNEILYLKADTQTLQQFRAAGSEPFMYQRRNETVPISYWSVPEAAMDSPQDMRPWLVLAHEAALRKAIVKPRKRKAATKTATAAKPAMKPAKPKPKTNPN